MKLSSEPTSPLPVARTGVAKADPALMQRAEQQYQSGQKTYDDGIDEWLQNGYQSLAYRLMRPGCRVGNGGRALSRFIGEKSPVHPPVNRKSETGPKESAHRGSACKSIAEH